MIFREAEIQDIKQIQIVRNAVTENTLSNPNLITDEDCHEFLFQRGKGWVAVGMHGNEIKFEMTFENWKNKKIPSFHLGFLLFLKN